MKKISDMEIMDKYAAVDKFRDLLIKEFIKLCNYNDYAKINLLLIDKTVSAIYEKCIEDFRKENKNEEL